MRGEGRQAGARLPSPPPLSCPGSTRPSRFPRAPHEKLSFQETLLTGDPQPVLQLDAFGAGPLLPGPACGQRRVSKSGGRTRPLRSWGSAPGQPVPTGEAEQPRLGCSRHPASAPVTPALWRVEGPSASKGGSISVPGLIIITTTVVVIMIASISHVLSSFSQPPFQVGDLEP